SAPITNANKPTFMKRFIFTASVSDLITGPPLRSSNGARVLRVQLVIAGAERLRRKIVNSLLRKGFCTMV
ncbi:MAG TPA: hypothetical protein VKD91_11605, partial [Pyrinomonadaceae bacterium]|nr:hypothetical protein [Pyrinomonadaceae bacterium]